MGEYIPKIEIPDDFHNRYMVMKFQGYTDKQVAEEHFFISLKTLYRWKKKLGIKLRRVDRHVWHYEPDND